jgi:Uma2 family endonuclease
MLNLKRRGWPLGRQTGHLRRDRLQEQAMIQSDTKLEPGPPITLKMQPAVDLSDAEFFALCQANRELRFERNAEGDVFIMSPTGGETGRRSALITAQLVMWALEDGSGTAFDSSTGFHLSDGSVRSPDAAWISNDRYASLSDDERQRFVPLCPDFVIELRSPSDGLEPLQAKMQAYVANGTRLAWLLDPGDRRVHVYRPDRAPLSMESPTKITSDPELPGFALNLEPIWR